jgi:glucoamylase
MSDKGERSRNAPNAGSAAGGAGDEGAFGHPGIEPRWTRSAKDAVGTAYTSASRVWFTTSSGVLNEVYYPTIDRPQIRDLILLVTDGKTFFHDERRHMVSETDYEGENALAVRITNTDPEGRYRIVKEILSDPHQACVLMTVKLEAAPDLAGNLRLFVLLAPHLNVGGAGNNARVKEVAGRTLLTASKGNSWLALGATVPFLRQSCGFVGRSDGWTDLSKDLSMDWEFRHAEDGNVALTGELDLTGGRELTLGLAFGDALHHAASTLFQSLGLPFTEQRERFLEQWSRACARLRPLEAASGDAGRLYRRSHSLLLAHEDKTYPGAMIASLSIPWGEVMGDEDLGGYHLVWTRDLVNSAMGLLASGNLSTPLRALIYLAATQNQDGGFYQNFWVDGRPYWSGIQLDEVAFPILLAWHLREAGALKDFDPYPTVLAAAGYLVRHGPATPQDRWEEVSGFSPSTLASNIAALTCASLFARERRDETTADYLQEHADFLNCHVEEWTVTTDGEILPEVSRHYVRINPVELSDPQAEEDPNRGLVRIANRLPGEASLFPGRQIVDAGFLELVRYGIRKAGSALMEDSLKVVDAMLKVETPAGPTWRRYNHDGYGQGPKGEPYVGAGRGRGWPLLTGERGHYELAAGRSSGPYLRAMEAFANGAGLLPEQVWDEKTDRPEAGLFFGRPTGSAMPLMWAHAEYIRLLRSTVDGIVFDRIPPVADRYLPKGRCRSLEVWKFNRQPRSVPTGVPFRIQAEAPFRLRWSRDSWSSWADTESRAVPALGIHHVDLEPPPEQRAPLSFTVYWTEVGRWEGRNFEVTTEEETHG